MPTYNRKSATCLNVLINSCTILCVAPAALTEQHHVRECTYDKTAIIVGLVKGTVARRRIPDFIKQVLNSKERLRLYSTIQEQVERELILQLNRARFIRLSRQMIKAYYPWSMPE